MVKVVFNANNTEITLRPNRSLSTKQARWLVFGVCTFVFIIALFWSMQGAFLVLPFAGLDIILFAYFILKTNQQSLRKQLITIDSQHVLIQSGKLEIEKSLTLSRADTVVVVTEQQAKKSLGLKLSDSKSYFELGAFLTQKDKIEVRKELTKLGLKEMNQLWWKTQ